MKNIFGKGSKIGKFFGAVGRVIADKVTGGLFSDVFPRKIKDISGSLPVVQGGIISKEEEERLKKAAYTASGEMSFWDKALDFLKKNWWWALGVPVAVFFILPKMGFSLFGSSTKKFR